MSEQNNERNGAAPSQPEASGSEMCIRDRCMN